VNESTVTRWWWVRHAPVPGPEDLIKGKLDLACDTSDTATFAAVAARLPAGAVTVTSSRLRCRQTYAALVAAGLSAAPPAIEPDFDEQDFGTLAGRTWTELGDGPELEAYWRDPANTPLPGGESFAQLVARVGPAIARIGVQSAGRDIVAVAHGGTIRAALAVALAITPAQALLFGVSTVSLTRIDAVNRAWRVVYANRPPLG
jgi:alpha-ribazole phosphatase